MQQLRGNLSKLWVSVVCCFFPFEQHLEVWTYILLLFAIKRVCSRLNEHAEGISDLIKHLQRLFHIFFHLKGLVYIRLELFNLLLLASKSTLLQVITAASCRQVLRPLQLTQRCITSPLCMCHMYVMRDFKSTGSCSSLRQCFLQMVALTCAAMCNLMSLVHLISKMLAKTTSIIPNPISDICLVHVTHGPMSNTSRGTTN